MSQTVTPETRVALGTSVGVTLETPSQPPQPNDNGNGISLGWVSAGVGVLLLGAVGLGVFVARRLIWPPDPLTPPAPTPTPPTPPAVILKPEANLKKSAMTVSAQPAFRLLVQLRGRPARAHYEVRQSNAIVTRKDSRG